METRTPPPAGGSVRWPKSGKQSGSSSESNPECGPVMPFLVRAQEEPSTGSHKTCTRVFQQHHSQKASSENSNVCQPMMDKGSVVHPPPGSSDRRHGTRALKTWSRVSEAQRPQTGFHFHELSRPAHPPPKLTSDLQGPRESWGQACRAGHRTPVGARLRHQKGARRVRPRVDRPPWRAEGQRGKGRASCAVSPQGSVPVVEAAWRITQNTGLGPATSPLPRQL